MAKDKRSKVKFKFALLRVCMEQLRFDGIKIDSKNYNKLLADTYVEAQSLIGGPTPAVELPELFEASDGVRGADLKDQINSRTNAIN